MSQSCPLLTSFGRDLLIKHKPPSAVISLASPAWSVWRHPYPLSVEWPWDGISWWILDFSYKLFWKYTCLQKSLVRNLSSDFNMNVRFFTKKTLELPYICLERGSVKLFLQWMITITSPKEFFPYISEWRLFRVGSGFLRAINTQFLPLAPP